MNRTGDQWPIDRHKKYYGTIRIRKFRPLVPYLTQDRFATIPQLLAQADMVQRARYNFLIGKFVRRATELFYGLEYLYPKIHTFHKLQPPTPDTENKKGKNDASLRK